MKRYKSKFNEASEWNLERLDFEEIYTEDNTIAWVTSLPNGKFAFISDEGKRPTKDATLLIFGSEGMYDSNDESWEEELYPKSIRELEDILEEWGRVPKRIDMKRLGYDKSSMAGSYYAFDKILSNGMYIRVSGADGLNDPYEGGIPIYLTDNVEDVHNTVSIFNSIKDAENEAMLDYSFFDTVKELVDFEKKWSRK